MQACLFAVAVLVLQAPSQAQMADPPLPVSMERIRAGLQQPPPRLKVQAPDEMPTFRVEVQQQAFVFRPDDEKPADLTFGLPSAGELLMGGIEKVRSAAVNYKRGRAERRARKEVEDALAAFCAVHTCPAPGASK
jgi:hypothetical protein